MKNLLCINNRIVLLCPAVNKIGGLCFQKDSLPRPKITNLCSSRRLQPFTMVAWPMRQQYLPSHGCSVAIHHNDESAVQRCMQDDKNHFFFTAPTNYDSCTTCRANFISFVFVTSWAIAGLFLFSLTARLDRLLIRFLFQHMCVH